MRSDSEPRSADPGTTRPAGWRGVARAHLPSWAIFHSAPQPGGGLPHTSGAPRRDGKTHSASHAVRQSAFCVDTLTEKHTLPRHPTHSGPPPYQKTCSARRHATHQATGHSAPLLSSSCLSPQHGLSCIERTKEARQDVRCSMDAPAREYRPARFPLVDIAHLGPRVKGRVLPDSPKSAPLTGGRFRRPAKTHEGTPSGAHFSHRWRVWRPAGGGRGGAGAQVACTGVPLRDRMRPRGADPCQAPAPRDRPPPAAMRRGACGTAPRKREAIKHSARRASHDGPPRGARRRCSPGRGPGVGRHPTSFDYEAHWGA